jgi:hypothetical protein
LNISKIILNNNKFDKNNNKLIGAQEIMTEFEYTTKINELDKIIDTYEEQIDILRDKQRECYQEKYKFEKLYNREKLANLKIEKDNVILGFAKDKDYHFVMIKSFIVSHVSGAQHIETVEHNYRCDDFDYSYRCSTSTISIDNIIDMFKDFDVFIFSMNEYNQLFSKMAMLQIHIDNFDNVINQFKALSLQKINN